MKWEKNIIDSFPWSKEISRRDEKEKVAAKIAGMVKDGDVIGVGSGSTSYLALLAIAQRVKGEGLHIKAIPTSQEITMTCAQLGIPVTSLMEYQPDWAFDGADEVDPNHSLIKGRGGAMFKEKLLINSSPRNYILTDSSKMVSRLGMKFPVPVEVFPQALTYVGKALEELSPREIKLRMAEGKDGPIITENGNLILDVWFDAIPDTTETALKSITGVIESGLFIGYQVNLIT
ncbi:MULTISPECIES: ribose 5-phosphate isomerase A [unclassified Parabacteroides]|uniref:ribose 5-phosphate isomerase A n=1 Tax=unclassified Parabacteroides TaxID=2649774 RepID=UPI0024741F38|nr:MULTISPECIES: ribose 5-phosphate isomerase A [unclassified Parabacteroides]